MKTLETLIFATICLTLSALAYYKKGCLETHIVSHVPFNQNSFNSSLKDLNDSTIILNCDKPCHISMYDKYKVFSYKLSENQFENFNETLDQIIQVDKDYDYSVTYYQNISHIKLRIWWTCLERHAHGELKHVLTSINKYH